MPNKGYNPLIAIQMALTGKVTVNKVEQIQADKGKLHYE